MFSTILSVREASNGVWCPSPVGSCRGDRDGEQRARWKYYPRGKLHAPMLN